MQARWWNGAAGSCPARTAQLTERHSRKCCYAATSLENISLLYADVDCSDLKEHRNICCSCASVALRVQGQRAHRLQGQGSHVGPISMRVNSHGCRRVCKLERVRQQEKPMKTAKVNLVQVSLLFSPSFPLSPPLPPPLSPPGSLQPILSRRCGCCSNNFKDYYGIR